jgi:hypothetical protein
MADYAPKFLPGHEPTYQAAAAIAGGQLVFLSAAGQITVTAAATSVPVVGVATTDAATGDIIAVSRGGVQRVVSGGALSVGDPVKAAATGRVVLYVVGTDPATQYLGHALTAAGGAGTVVDVQWEK